MPWPCRLNSRNSTFSKSLIAEKRFLARVDGMVATGMIWSLVFLGLSGASGMQLATSGWLEN
eukprot:1536747-Pyramimonas_sp.AAC.1